MELQSRKLRIYLILFETKNGTTLIQMPLYVSPHNRIESETIVRQGFLPPNQDRLKSHEVMIPIASLWLPALGFKMWPCNIAAEWRLVGCYKVAEYIFPSSDVKPWCDDSAALRRRLHFLLPILGPLITQTQTQRQLPVQLGSKNYMPPVAF